MIVEDAVQFGATNVDAAASASRYARHGPAFDAKFDRLFVCRRIRNLDSSTLQQSLLHDQTDAGKVCPLRSCDCVRVINESKTYILKRNIKKRKIKK